MKNIHSPLKRRLFFKLAALAGVSFLPWGRYAISGQASLEHLSEDDPLAIQLKYVHDANSSQEPSRKDNAFCHNCRYFQDQKGAEWGGCQLFPNKAVNRQGWCNVWVSNQ